MSRRRHTPAEPLPVSPSPLHAVGRRVPLADEGCYTFDAHGAHDPLYYCTCGDVEGTHPRRICGKAYKA